MLFAVDQTEDPDDSYGSRDGEQTVAQVILVLAENDTPYEIRWET